MVRKKERTGSSASTSPDSDMNAAITRDNWWSELSEFLASISRCTDQGRSYASFEL